MSDRPLSDVQQCADGTSFSVHSELVRGEPRFFWIERRLATDDKSKRVAATGTYNKKTAQRTARKLAEQHDSKE